jgi:hypothetical protein
MWPTIVTACAWLPEITTVLKFCSALIGFVVAARSAFRRVDDRSDRGEPTADRPEVSRCRTRRR